MGFFDRARSVLGLPKSEPPPPSREGAPRAPAGRAGGRKKKDGRPPLPQVSEGASATIDDVLSARARGAFPEARAILAAIDKGQGLRTVLRAAAALEAGDEEEVTRLLPLVEKEQPPWQLALQVAALLERGERREALVREAKARGAPPWSLAWIRALSPDENESRAALVDLLFEDAALARTVAARDLGLADVKPDNDAIRRYTAFAHGRDVIRRFGAAQVSALLERTTASRR